jgi:hypothetical protein
MPLVATYPYLVGSLAFALLFALLYAINPAYRRVALVSAVLSTPYSLLAVVFVPAYWEPVQVFRIMAGPEDLLFSFATGGMVWIFAAGAYDAAPDHLWSRRCCGRLAQATALFLALWIVIRQVEVPIMWAALAAGAVLWCCLVARDKAAIRVSMRGAAVFATGYTLIVAGVIYANPEFVRSWSPEGLLGLTILGVPIEETLWAFEFAAIWPLMIAYSFDMKSVRTVTRGTAPTGERTFGTTASPA